MWQLMLSNMHMQLHDDKMLRSMLRLPLTHSCHADARCPTQASKEAKGLVKS
jgi:hypothetical protein